MENLISIAEFSKHYNVEYSFITSLQKFGLIQITTLENDSFLDADRLDEIEKYVRLHHELDINLEGIEAINYLLERMRNMQDEIIMLKNRLDIYENDDDMESENY